MSILKNFDWIKKTKRYNLHTFLEAIAIATGDFSVAGSSRALCLWGQKTCTVNKNKTFFPSNVACVCAYSESITHYFNNFP